MKKGSGGHEGDGQKREKVMGSMRLNDSQVFNPTTHFPFWETAKAYGIHSRAWGKEKLMQRAVKFSDELAS